jgi:hypothetical protein
MTLTLTLLRMRQGIGLLCVAGLLAAELASTAHAQSAPIVYPGAGQSMDQQALDESECRNWATQQTGIYPNQAPPAYYGNSNQQGAPVARGAARGAAVSSIAGGDAGKGAAVGATAGVIRKNQARRQEAQINEQAAAQYQADMGRYYQAFAVCMQGRGYAVQ